MEVQNRKITNETALLLPFALKDVLKCRTSRIMTEWNDYFVKNGLGQYWRQGRNIDSKYFLKHACQNGGNCIHYEYDLEGNQENDLQAYNFTDMLELKTSLNNRDRSYDIYNIKLSMVSLFFYPTGIGFLVIRYEYCDNETLENIINISASMSRFYANDRGGENSYMQFKNIDKECQVSIKAFVNKILGISGNKEADRIELFPNSNNSRTFVFQKLAGHNPNKYEKTALRRNLWLDFVEEAEGADEGVSEVEYHTDLSDIEDELQLEYNRDCYMSPKVMCVVTKKFKDIYNEFTRQNNIRFSYFNVFMITLHEQQALLLYDQTVINNDCSTQLINLMKDNLQIFLTTYSYKVISEEIHYQRIFLALRNILNMDSLEENVSDTIFMLDEECKQNRERTINGLMTIIGIWGLFSAVGDLLTIMDLAINQKVFDNIATYIAMAIMSGVLVVAVAVYFVYKYVERK